MTPTTDEAKVKSVVSEYFLAINDQNWSKAKGYCVYGSDRYYATCTMEDLINNMCQLYNVVTITCYADIYNVVITGNYAEAYFNSKKEGFLKNLSYKQIYKNGKSIWTTWS